MIELHHGDCIEVMRTLPDNSVDSICTDPPYGLSSTSPERVTEAIVAWATGDRDYIPAGKGFMGKSWDAFVPPPALWDEAMRVLKPGGHLLAFAGTRTQDLMGLSIRLAGFEIRENLAWMHGQGFPKSQNVSKAIKDNRCGCAVPYNHDNISREDVPAVRRDLAATEPLPIDSEPDVLEGVRQVAAARGHDGQEARDKHSGDGVMFGVPAGVPEAGGMGQASDEPLLLLPVQREGSGAGVGSSRAQGPGGAEDIHPHDGSGQPGMEGRRDAESREGELRRPALRPLPGGMDDDGTEGRLHHGASASDGSMGGQAATSHGSGESHEPRSAGQSAGEPGTVPVERGSQARGGWPVCAGCGKPVIPDGLGTALKPAYEPIIMARKPLSGKTVAANVQTHGTGALNIDGCRIGETVETWPKSRMYGGNPSEVAFTKTSTAAISAQATGPAPAGRWPANVALDEHMAAVLDRQSGVLHSQATDKSRRSMATGATSFKSDKKERVAYPLEIGGASRFFYVAKAPKKERPIVDGVAHATVKPLALMRWLVRLVTPEGGTVLEPFAGSGTTVEACILEGFHCIAIEREAEYLPLIQARIERREVA